AYLANYGIEKGQTVALVNIGAKTTTINVIEDGISHLTRDFAVAGNQFTKQMQTEMNWASPRPRSSSASRARWPSRATRCC
ncbi:MAG TPA: pilus assembly protein PilM, partial [bacterium]|nr:pilus assembly protein PilM [bacterium]